mmetsp:Transcript_10279/g.41592  ORF Transcript_10279/g.41592 Transcript_10279/m.41592 type:complete len:275 (+) Transcript_10279:218-1042(+)
MSKTRESVKTANTSAGPVPDTLVRRISSSSPVVLSGLRRSRRRRRRRPIGVRIGIIVRRAASTGGGAAARGAAAAAGRRDDGRQRLDDAAVAFREARDAVEVADRHRQGHVGRVDRVPGDLLAREQVVGQIKVDPGVPLGPPRARRRARRHRKRLARDLEFAANDVPLGVHLAPRQLRREQAKRDAELAPLDLILEPLAAREPQRRAAHGAVDATDDEPLVVQVVARRLGAPHLERHADVVGPVDDQFALDELGNNAADGLGDGIFAAHGRCLR